MQVHSTEEFRPEWVSAPGETMADILAERRMSVSDFARQLEEPADHARDLLDGRATITLGLARKLERVLGGSVQFWMTRDFQYRQDVARLHAGDQDWLHELPVGDMIKFGWLKPAPHPSEEVAACLRFFGVPNVSVWRQAYSNVQEAFAFRTSPTFESLPGAVTAWLLGSPRRSLRERLRKTLTNSTRCTLSSSCSTNAERFGGF